MIKIWKVSGNLCAIHQWTDHNLIFIGNSHWFNYENHTKERWIMYLLHVNNKQFSMTQSVCLMKGSLEHLFDFLLTIRDSIVHRKSSSNSILYFSAILNFIYFSTFLVSRRSVITSYVCSNLMHLAYR